MARLRAGAGAPGQAQQYLLRLVVERVAQQDGAGALSRRGGFERGVPGFACGGLWAHTGTSHRDRADLNR